MDYDWLQLNGVLPVGTREENGYLLIVADSDVPAPQQCPSCGNHPLYKHGKRQYSYADTPMHGKPVRIEMEQQRYRCKACKAVITPEIPSLDDSRQATRRLIDYVRGRCFSTTFTLLSKELGLAVNTIKAIALDYAEWLEKNLPRQTPRLLGLDEVNIAGGYRAVMVNLEMRTVFDVHENRKLQSMRRYFKNLKDKENIEWVSADMWDPYKILISEQVPDARMVIDRFHVVRMASTALEKTRIQLQSNMTREERLPIKKNIRWSLLRRGENRSNRDWEMIEHIRDKHPALALAFDLKEQFFEIYEQPDRASGEQAFESWLRSIPSEFMHGRDSFGYVGETVNRHYQDIFNYFDCPITNGYTEAMNGVMKAANRMGRGYSYEIIRAKLLYSKIPLQAGKVIKHEGVAKDIREAVSTWGKSSVSQYGSHISTLDDLAERGEID